MSVPKSKRKVAEFEFYATALKIRTQITEWLMRDFGTKTRFRDVSLVARKARMTDADKTALADLFERYGLGDTVCETYPDWWIAERRRTLDVAGTPLACGLNVAVLNAVIPNKNVQGRDPSAQELSDFIDASVAGRVTRRDVCNFYQSFRGAAKRFDNYRSLRNLDRLYDELFVQR